MYINSLSVIFQQCLNLVTFSASHSIVNLTDNVIYWIISIFFTRCVYVAEYAVFKLSRKYILEHCTMHLTNQCHNAFIAFFSHELEGRTYLTLSLFSKFSGDPDVVFCGKTLETTYASQKKVSSVGNKIKSTTELPKLNFLVFLLLHICLSRIHKAGLIIEYL